MKITKEDKNGKKSWSISLEIGDNMFWILFWILVFLALIFA